MDVMKGVDPGPSTAEATTSSAVPGEKGWIAYGDLKGKKDKIKMGKEKSKEHEVTEIGNSNKEDLDDAAWMKQRQGNMEGDVVDNPASVSLVQESRSS